MTFQILQLLPSLCSLNSPTDIIFSRLRFQCFNNTYKKEAQLMHNHHPECLEYTNFMVSAYLYNLNNFADGWPSYKKRFQRFHNCLRFSWAWCYLDSLLLLLCAVIIELCSSISRYHSAGGRVVYLAVHCVLLKDNWSKIENLNIGRLKDWFGQGWRIQEEKRI